MVLTGKAHVFMWQVRMGRSQGETGQNKFPEPPGLSYRAEGSQGNTYFSGSQLGMILAPTKIFGNGSLMWVTGGQGMPAVIQGLRAQSPRSPSVLGAAPQPPPSQMGQLLQLTAPL